MNHRKQLAAGRVRPLAGAIALFLAVLIAPALPAFAVGTGASTLGVVNINTATSDELQLLPG
ncbi:MAG: hypothetical protein VCB42_05080, partial [Myxococcota bacterium]